MTDDERAVLQKLYELQQALYHYQGEQIDALEKTIAACQRTHAVVGEMLKLTAQLGAFRPKQP